MYNYMAAKIQNIKLQMQLQAVPVSDLSLSKVTYQNIFVSSDLAPDLDILNLGDHIIVHCLIPLM